MIYEQNTTVSALWAEAFLDKYENVQNNSMMIFRLNTLNGFLETQSIRGSLDNFLHEIGEKSINTVANTIFPCSLIHNDFNHKSLQDRQNLYQRYANILPLIKKMKGNSRGLYFERIINYNGVNQLENIIKFYNEGNHRNSNMQLALLDPAKDIDMMRQKGFPCLQQVSFSVDSDTKNVRMIALYANQCLIEKSYGNLLGLYRLGEFFSLSIGKKLEWLTCIAGAEVLSMSISKKVLLPLYEQIKEISSK